MPHFDSPHIFHHKLQPLGWRRNFGKHDRNFAMMTAPFVVDLSRLINFPRLIPEKSQCRQVIGIEIDRVTVHNHFKPNFIRALGMKIGYIDGNTASRISVRESCGRGAKTLIDSEHTE